VHIVSGKGKHFGLELKLETRDKDESNQSEDALFTVRERKDDRRWGGVVAEHDVLD